ncbi:MAG: type II secretion system minor pseudopilin GspI [Steroidobacteraceae bacterium]|jgi:general secretion pathway protein I
MSPYGLPPRASSRGFTLIEVLVALAVVALGLTALMVAVSGTARTSGYLRDKTVAQWIALNRLTQVRLQVNKLGDTQDTGQIDFAGQKWHYDTRYFDTQFQSMKRVVVRVYPGDTKTKSNPIAESTGFLGSSLGIPGGSNVDWTVGSTMTAAPCVNAATTSGAGGLGGNTVSSQNQQLGAAQSPNCTPASGTPATLPGTNPTSPVTSPQGQTTP